MKPRMILIASLAAALSAGAFAQSGGGLPPVTDKTPIYGSQIMTQQERLEYLSQMRAAKTLEEREQIRARHHEQMVERAREKGVTLPAEPPARGGGMGPGPGMGPGGGMGPVVEWAWEEAWAHAAEWRPAARTADSCSHDCDHSRATAPIRAGGNRSGRVVAKTRASGAHLPTMTVVGKWMA